MESEIGQEKEVSGFAPDDPTDGREKGQWATRYDSIATKHIFGEAYYLGGIFLLDIVLIFYLATDCLTSICDNESLKIYGLAWLGGTLGGTLFSIKWLYHSVARNLWNFDRRLWRIFTPHISGALAFMMVILVSSGIVSVFDEDSIYNARTTLGFGFLVGYFSDTAIGKLSEVAATFFGSTEKHGLKHKK